MRSKTIAKGTVVIRDGLIKEVGENARIPADARIINGTGMTVYPGLIDGFTSLGLPAPTPAPAGGGGRQAALAAAAAAGQQPDPTASHGDPSLSAADQVKPGGTTIDDERAVGVTTALTSSQQGIFPGQSAVINLAGEDATRMVVRAPVALTVQFSTSRGVFSQYPNSLMGTVAFVRQTFYDAMHYRDAVERYNRVKRGVERPAYDKKLAALQPALKSDLPVIFIANSEGDIRRALMIADEFKLKPIIAGALYGSPMAETLKAKKVPVILSVDYPRRAPDLPEDEDEPLRVLRQRAEAPKGAARFAQAGVKFAFMAGAARPADFIANVQKAVENGLSKDDALRALTLNAAEILGTADQLGSIEVGKIANLVVTSGDLFAKDTRVRHLFIDGKEIELKKPEAAPARAGGPRAAGPAARAVDPSGEWTLTANSPHGEMRVRLTLRKDGEQINGTMATPMGNVEIHNGKLTGNDLRFNATMQSQASAVETTVTATIEGDNMRGSIAIPGMGSFDFTGTRPK
jgi:imidazolonepropionase-like amidohydrolase